MHILIIFAALEIVAIIFVAALCVTARRADERTERALTRDEVEVRRQVADASRPARFAPFRRRMTWRWLATVLRTGDRDKSGS